MLLRNLDLQRVTRALGQRLLHRHRNFDVSDLAGNSGSCGSVSRSPSTAPAPHRHTDRADEQQLQQADNTTPTFSGACTTGDGNVTILVKQGSNDAIQTRSAACTSGVYTVAASPALTDNAYTAQASRNRRCQQHRLQLNQHIHTSVDTTAPITTIMHPASPNGTNGWYTGTLPRVIILRRHRHRRLLGRHRPLPDRQRNHHHVHNRGHHPTRPHTISYGQPITRQTSKPRTRAARSRSTPRPRHNTHDHSGSPDGADNG